MMIENDQVLSYVNGLELSQAKHDVTHRPSEVMYRLESRANRITFC